MENEPRPESAPASGRHALVIAWLVILSSLYLALAICYVCRERRNESVFKWLAKDSYQFKAFAEKSAPYLENYVSEQGKTEAAIKKIRKDVWQAHTNILSNYNFILKIAESDLETAIFLRDINERITRLELNSRSY